MVLIVFASGDTAVAQSPATATTPLRSSAATGSFDALSVEQRQAIADNVLRARGVQAQPYTVQAGTSQSYYAERVAQAAWDAEAKVTRVNYGAINFSTNQLKTRVASGALRRFAMGAGTKIITRAVPGVGAFMFGWEIGSGLNKLFVDVEADPVGPTVAPQYVELWYSEQARWANSSGWIDGAPPNQEPVAPAGSIAARFKFNGYGVNLNLKTGDACQDMRPSPTMYRKADGYSYGRCFPAVPAEGYYWLPEDLIVSSRPTTTPPSHWSLYSMWGGWVGDKVTQDFPPLPADTQVEQALRQQLDSPDGALQREVWKWIFDHLPTPTDPVWDDPDYQTPTLDPTEDGAPLGRVRVPDGIGTSQTAYHALLNQNDLDLGDVQVSNNFNRDHDPGDVLYVDPAQQTWVPRGSSIDVVVNPNTITVPPTTQGELGEDYAARAYRAGFDPVEQLTPTSGSDEDEAVGTTPAAGQVEQPRTQLVVKIGKRPKKREHRPGCEAPGSFSAPTHATNPKENELTIEHRFASAIEPGGEVLLRRGYTWEQPAQDLESLLPFTNYAGFGRKHIEAKHGWGSAEQAQTQSAVAAPTRITPPGVSLAARHNYELDFRSGAGNDCTWTVVVEPDEVETSFAPEQGQTGIITAYGAPR